MIKTVGKKLFISLTVILMTVISVSGAEFSKDEALSAVENGLFGYEYKNEQVSRRVERIETRLYGGKKTGDITARIKNIQNDTGIIPVKPVDKTVKKDSDASTYNATDIAKSTEQESRTLPPEPELKETDGVEYPIVDKMEQEIFGKTYKKDSIYVRLDRLEEKVLNKKTTDNLSDRVDRLSSVLSPKKYKNDKNQYLSSEPSYSAEELDKYYSSQGFETVTGQSMPFQLAALEEDLFKSRYEDEPNSRRLVRLEQKLFNRTFATDTDATRVQRLMVAYEAKKNDYKFDANKKAQNAAALTQIGGILLMILAILL